MEVVDEIFAPNEAEMIKNMPLARGAAEDILFWPYLSDGNYNCKSGYRFLKEEPYLEVAQQFSSQEKHLWAALWALNVLQKLKNLLWRACRNAMPTKESLVRRTIINDPLCDCCHQALETPLHVLWLCTKLDIVWADAALWGFQGSTTFKDFRELLSWVITQSRNVILFTYMVWAVWTQRNQVCLRKPAQALHQLPQLSKDRILEFLSSQVSSNAQPRSTTRYRCRWKLPSSPKFVKINFDYAILSSKNHSSIGVDIRDTHGLVIASYLRKLPYANSAAKVESLAATMALSFASDIGISCAVLEGNSWEVFKALIDDEPALTPYDLLVNDAKVLSRNFDQLLYSYTRREGNFVVYSLARYVINIPDYLVWMEDVPP